jgi:hypothetical protein
MRNMQHIADICMNSANSEREGIFGPQLHQNEFQQVELLYPAMSVC